MSKGQQLVKLSPREEHCKVARAAARVAYAFLHEPGLETVVVYRSPGGSLMVRPGTQRPTGELLGVYGPDVSIRQLIDDLGDE